jgi:hypothetical protein
MFSEIEEITQDGLTVSPDSLCVELKPAPHLSLYFQKLLL